MSASKAALRARFAERTVALAMTRAGGEQYELVIAALVYRGLAVHRRGLAGGVTGWQVTHAASGLLVCETWCSTERKALALAVRLAHCGDWERPYRAIRGDGQMCDRLRVTLRLDGPVRIGSW